MTNLILKPQLQEKEQVTIGSNNQHYTLKGLVGLINTAFNKMERSHYQLTKISNEHHEKEIRSRAGKLLIKHTHLLGSMITLLEAVYESIDVTANNELLPDALIRYYFKELDRLNSMDFNESQINLSFIYNHYEPTISLRKSMAS